MRTSTKIGLSLMAGLALVGGTAQAQVTKKPNGYLFRQKFTPGQTARYTIRVNQMGAQGGGGFNVVLPMSMKVNSVKAGVATVTVTAGRTMLNGKPMGNAPQRPTILRLNSQGKVVGGAQGQSPNFAVLPANPVPVGGTWSSMVPVAQFGNAKAVYKFLGLGNVGGRQVARIGMTLSSQGQARLTGSGTTLVSVADGSPVGANVNVNVTLPASRQGTQPQVMRMKISISRS